MFDFAQLNKLCGTQISSDITAEQLAEFIEGGAVTVAQLAQCTAKEQSPAGDDPYEAKLQDLASKKAAGSIKRREIDSTLEAIKEQYKRSSRRT